MESFLILAIISILAAAAIPGLSAWHLKASDYSGILSVCNAFGSGVFLAAGLIHLLPDARKEFGSETGYPWAEFLCSLGFLSMLLLEQSATIAMKLKGGLKPKSASGEREGESDQKLQNMVDGRSTAEELSPLLGTPPRTSSTFGTTVGHIPEAGGKAPRPGKATTTSVFFLILALGTHSVLAGIALGANGASAVGVFIAILAHKSVAAFVLGNTMVEAGLAFRQFATLIGAFSLTTPSGIVIGHELAGASRDSATQGVFLSLAAGIFLYISVVELLHKNVLHSSHGKQAHPRLKLCALSLGYFFMAIIAVWV